MLHCVQHDNLLFVAETGPTTNIVPAATVSLVASSTDQWTGDAVFPVLIKNNRLVVADVQGHLVHFNIAAILQFSIVLISSLRSPLYNSHYSRWCFLNGIWLPARPLVPSSKALHQDPGLPGVRCRFHDHVTRLTSNIIFQSNRNGHGCKASSTGPEKCIII